MMSRSRFLVIMTVVAAMLLGTLNTVLAQSNTLIIWADNTRAPALLALADQVEAELGVQLEVVQQQLGEIRDQLLIAGPVGEGPDIIIAQHDWLGQLVSNGAVLPVDLGDVESEFSPGAINLFTFNGELYGLPYAIENLALVRNTDLVPEAPTTWAEVRAISEEIQSSEAATYGYLNKDGNLYNSYPELTSFGGYIFATNEDGSYNPADVGLSSEGGLAYAEWLSSMYADGLMVTNVDDDVLFQLFEDGEVAMFPMGPWWSTRITEAGLPYSIDMLPRQVDADSEAVGGPFSGGNGFMLSAFSENQLLAEIFLLDYVATTEFMTALFEVDPRSPAWLSVDTSNDPNIGAFVAAGEFASPMPAIPEMGAVWGSAGNALTLVAQGEDPVDAFTIAVEQINDAIVIVNSTERIVGLPGSHQAAVGCAGDWLPDCDVTFLEDQGDGIYTLTLTIPAGDYEYKVAMNGGWEENYGFDGVDGGDNIILSLAEETEVTFTYDDNTNVVIDSVNNGVEQVAEEVEEPAEEPVEEPAEDGERVVGLPGSHQAAAGCEGDWDPACEVTLLADQGDGIYTLTLTLPAGDYEYKVAMNGGWDENYGVDGAAGGDNIVLSLAEETEVTFTYDDNTNVVTDSVNNG